MSVIGELAVVERERLDELEQVVERGLTTFLEVGRALLEIREARLYRQSHATFADYCRARWGFSDSRARQLIGAVRVVTAVTAAGLPAPTSEREAREIGRLLREIERADDEWRRAFDEAAAALDLVDEAGRQGDELRRWTASATALADVHAAAVRATAWAERAAGLLLASDR